MNIHSLFLSLFLSLLYSPLSSLLFPSLYLSITLTKTTIPDTRLLEQVVPVRQQGFQSQNKIFLRFELREVGAGVFPCLVLLQGW
jgi:hypothetical protein